MKKKQIGRRSFLRNGLLAATGIMIVPRHVLGGNGFIAPSDRLRVAGIGAGGKGESDLANFFASGKADIVSLCDVDDRRAATTRKRHPKASYHKDFRKMLDADGARIDAVCVSTPDHNHAIQALAAMQMGKHVYVQKPLTHDIFEARVLTQAAEKYKVVTQMGNQGASGDGVRVMQEWHDAGAIGKVHTVYCWTDRPVWPQGIPWSNSSAPEPAGLDWNLWLGTAPFKAYVPKLVPFNWRGWWDYGTGALGDMGCHLMEAPFKILGLGYPSAAECSVGSVYVDEFVRGYFPESGPPSSHVILKFDANGVHDGITMHWMDGGIQPQRPLELGPNDLMGDGGNGILIEGTKGKILGDVYGANPRLLPATTPPEIPLSNAVPRIVGQEGGHYRQWVEAAIAGYGSKEAAALSAPFSTSGPLTETVLMGNLAIRSFDLRKKSATNPNDWVYPGRYVKLLWDGPNMKVTNFDEANQFVRRQYRAGFTLNGL
jgi:predicted dehydrogenase